MNLKFLLNLYKNKKTENNEFSLSTLIEYFFRLKYGEITKKIYKISKKDSKIEYLDQAEKILDEIIRNALSKFDLRNSINMAEKIGYENIGIGCFVTPAMFGHPLLITQNIASLYFPTKIKKTLKLEIDFLAIPKISGQIFFEDELIHSFSIPTLTSYKKEIEIKEKFIENEISKITINVDQCWSPNFLDSKLPNFPLGIGIKSINLI